MKYLLSILSTLLFFSLFVPNYNTFVNAEADWEFDPEISIPGIDSSTFGQPTCKQEKGQEVCYVNWFGQFIGGIYNYAISIVGILAAVVLMFGGFLWLTSGGSSERVSDAKAWITGALTGLILVLCSYMILNFVNPDLVSLKGLRVVKIDKKLDEINIGCCNYSNSEPAKNLTEKQCIDSNGTFLYSKFAINDKCEENSCCLYHGQSGTAGKTRYWDCKNNISINECNDFANDETSLYKLTSFNGGVCTKESNYWTCQ